MFRFPVWLALLLSQWSALILAAEEKSSGGWTCEADGYWYQNGEKTAYNGCDEKKLDGPSDTKKDTGPPCNATHMLTADGRAALGDFPRTCISADPNGGPRCWWTHVPDAVKASTDSSLRVPLVIDMHGGGGCASHQLGSGFKALSDSLPAAETFIVAWPQGAGSLWASCGSDCTTAKGLAAAQEKGGGTMASWDDLAFLTQMAANIVKGARAPEWRGRVDAERVYVTGFSLGCMMAQRFAMERGRLVAGLGCHGGALSLVETTVGAELDAEKAKFEVQPMPTYLTIGDGDPWLPRARLAHHAWAHWNGCAANSTRAVALPPFASGKGNASGSSAAPAVERTGSSCAPYSPPLRSVALEITGGAHVPDPRMAARTWGFLKEYTRPGALAALPAAVPETDPTTQSSGAGLRAGNTVMMWAVVAVGCVLMHQP